MDGNNYQSDMLNILKNMSNSDNDMKLLVSMIVSGIISHYEEKIEILKQDNQIMGKRLEEFHNKETIKKQKE